MLYLYKNELNTYQVIDDTNMPDGSHKETTLFESDDETTAVSYFDREVSNRKKITLFSFDGSQIKDYR